MTQFEQASLILFCIFGGCGLLGVGMMWLSIWWDERTPTARGALPTETSPSPVDPLALQEAWDDVNEIERYCGLAPTKSPAPRIVRSAVAPTQSPAPRMVRTADDARQRLAELREDWEQVRQPPRPSNYAQIVGALYAEVDMLDRTIGVLERKEAAQKMGAAK